MNEQEEFQFRLRLEREKTKSPTVSGVAAEGGKGLVRGVSDVATGVGSALTKAVLGPVVGPMAAQGIESLAAPSRSLVQASPENTTEQFAGTAGEIVGSALPSGGASTVGNAALTAASALGGAVGEQMGGETGKLIGMVTPGVASLAKAPMEKAARSLMSSALKPSAKDWARGDAARAITTMLDEGVSPTASGVKKLREGITEINDEIKSIIGSSTATVQTKNAGKYLQIVLDKFSKQVDSGADLEAINKTWKNFLNNPLVKNGQIPVQTAQEMKQGTYKILDKKYGQVGSAEDEAQKSIARGIKDEISEAVPAVAGLNAREGDLINAMKLAEKRAFMELNKNPMGLALLANNPATWAAFMADRSGAFKAAVARLLHSSQKGLPDVGTSARIIGSEMASQ